MNSTKIKNLFFGIIISLCTFVLGTAFFPISTPSKIAAAEDANIPNYFSAVSVTEDNEVTPYQNGQTILLKSGERFELSLGNGKSLNLSTVDNEELSLNYGIESFATVNGDDTKPNSSEFFPLDLSLSSIKITRDNQNVELKDLVGESYTLPQIHYFSNSYDGTNITSQSHKVFEWFKLNIEESKLESGKYTFTFDNYYEFSGTDYVISSAKSFSVSFYIFKESDYLTTAGEPKVTMKNARTENLASSTRTYQKNYFFNYSNQGSTTVNTLNLPTLSFDGRKFAITIQKSFQGTIQNSIIYFNGENIAVQGDNIVRTKLLDNYNIEITFNDLGEYVLVYNFVYLMDGQTITDPSEFVKLDNEKFNSMKPNKLDVFGYQIYYNDINLGQIKEFKILTEDNVIEINDGIALTADITYKTSNETEIIENNIPTITAETLEPNSTNQAPISFKYNVNLNTTTSVYYTYENGTWSEAKTWSNNSLTENGIYLLKVDYTYQNNISYGVTSPNETFTQYFYFKITTETPKPETLEIKEDGTSAILGSNAYTKNEVQVSVEEQSKFNSPVRLVVQAKNYTSPNYYDLTPNADGKYYLSENKNYKVILYYGANYTQNTAKNRVSYFTIDTTDISGIGFKVATKGQSSTYTKGAVINFFTNTYATFEWAEKASGAKTTAYYKYIPFKTSNLTDNPNDFTGIESNNSITTTFFDNNNALRNGYTLDYTSGTLIKNLYNNTFGKNVVSDTNLLTKQGLYIFEITDEAGNSAFATLVIDNTSPLILQKINGVYEEIKPYNVISADARIDWGQYKLIGTGFTKSSLELDTVDPWLYKILNEKLATSNDVQYFKDGYLYLSPEISSTAYMLSGNNYIQLNNVYSQNISFLQNGIANETNYTFYIIDESNQYFNSLTQENFTNNYSASLNVKVSSDASGADVLVMPDQISDIETMQATSLYEVGTTDSYKYSIDGDVVNVDESYINTRIKYYTATGKRKSSNEDVNKLIYIFNPTPNDNIEVDKVIIYYYQFETYNEENYSTYKLSDICTTITIYDKSENINLAKALTGDFEGYYYYEINVSYIDQAYKTLEGKYVIERIYTESTENYLQSTTTNDKYDFAIRKNVFIVDRQNIVSSPEILADNEYKSLIGQHIYVSMLEDNNTTTFNEIYKTYSNENVAILETNKLPIKIFVPNFKYASGNSTNITPYNDISYFYYSEPNEADKLYYYGDFSPKDSSGTFIYDENGFPYQTLARTNFTGTSTSSTNIKSSVHNSSFDLSVKIYYSPTLTGDITNFTLFENLTVNENNYFVSNNITNAGFYKITITQNASNSNYPNVQTEISFIIEIVSIAPEFEFTTTNDEKLNTYPENDQYAVTYYNGNTIRVTWTDPVSAYLAKIDQSDANNDGKVDKIYYYTSTDPLKLNYISKNDIKSGTVQNSYYFDIDISNLASGTSLFVYMTYEGKDYNNGYHSINRELYIDRLAPIEKLQSLADKTKLNGNQFIEYSRRYTNIDETENIYGLTIENVGTSKSYKYNISTANGALAYYSFMLTKDELKNFVTPSSISSKYGEGYYYYYKVFEDGTKYDINQYWQETSIVNAQNAIASHKLLTSSTDFDNEIKDNYYYEIIEIDLAGNISIYTVYVVNPEESKSISMLEATADDPNSDEETSLINFDDYTYSKLSTEPTQTIYARNSFEVNQFGLFTFNINEKGYFVFAVNNTIYLSSPYLSQNTFYNISSWSGLADTLPDTVTLNEIMNIKTSLNSSYKQIKLQDSAYNKTYTFNVYCTSEDLSVSLTSNREGIIITAPTYLTLNSITISEWVDTSIEFVEIYSASGNYNNNEKVTVTKNNNYWTFVVTNPLKVAYRYSFTDNFGKEYSIAHTYGTTVINDAVHGEIAEIIDNEYKTWYYGINSMNFYYNEVDYNASISVEHLVEKNSKFSFETILQNQNVANPTSITNNLYYSCQSPSNDKTIGIITLKEPVDIISNLPFTGGIYKFTITLKNVNDNSTQEYNILINTLKPKISLYDKNDTNKDSLFETLAIFSGQLRIEYFDIFNYLEFTDDIPFFFPYSVTIQYANNKEESLTSGTVVDQVGTYTIRIYGNLNGTHLLETKTFTISDSQKDFYQVSYYDENDGTYKPALETGTPYIQNNITYSSHYIVNSSYEIYVNEEQDIVVTEYENLQESNNGTTTRFYEISNYASKNPNINYFKKVIAITTVPKSSSIINNFSYFNSNGLETSFTGISSSIIATVDDQELDSLTILWDSYYLIEENIVSIEVKYGSNAENVYDTSNVTQSGEKSSISLSLSGEYTIIFKDLAGNTHTFVHPTFGYQSQSYSLTFIKNVMFEINGESPIDNGIYNDQVIVSIPESTKDYYDTGYQPVIHAKKNGEEYSITKTDGTYTFVEPGYYEVYFTARINGKDVREEGSSFTIINKNETRWAFEFSEYKNYEITSVEKDGVELDLTKSSKYQIYNEGKVDEYIVYKNVLISLYDEQTGAGRYKIDIRTNSGIENQSFSFEFWINDAEIPIEVSVPEGTNTTETIIVTYNPYNIYSNVGDCTIVAGRNVININEENSSGTVQTLEINNEGTWFIQIYTDSGRLLYSYKVIKSAPLTTLAIILIVVACVVVVTLIIVMILLRKRMRIR